MFSYNVRKYFFFISIIFNLLLLSIILSNFFNHRDGKNKCFQKVINENFCNDEFLLELNRKINQVLIFKNEYWNYLSNLILFNMKNGVLELNEHEISILVDMNK